MKRTYFLFFALLMATATGCSVAAPLGEADLPEGIENAWVPEVDIGGYLYYSSDSPLALNADYFLANHPGGGDLDEEQRVWFDRASIVVGPSLDEFGGILEFSSPEDADLAWSLLQEKTEFDSVWGMLDSPRMLFASGSTDWSSSVKTTLETGELISLPEHDTSAWSLITHLPQNPPVDPVAAGYINLEKDVLETLGRKAGIVLSGIDDAFGFVKVNTVGFGVYSNDPVEIAVRIDEEYLNNSRASVLFVSQSTYPGGLVAFMLSVIASRTEMELIELGDTNARYRTLEDLHLIIKNRGSLVYAAIAPNRQDAEDLILSALAD